MTRSLIPALTAKLLAAAAVIFLAAAVLAPVEAPPSPTCWVECGASVDPGVSGTAGAAETPSSLYSIVDQIGARSAWYDGVTGTGIDVAVIDTGIAPVRALAESGKIAAVVDLSFEAGDRNSVFADTYGHGTHLAGIIAGRDPGADPADAAANPAQFLGVAPDAGLVSVKVADSTGAVDVSQVIAGIDWVVENRSADGLNIRVLNISYGTDSLQPYEIDPLAAAVERAWDAGIVVVVAAGNDGETRTGLNNPAHDPFVISVGAADTTGGVLSVPSWSAVAEPGGRMPDLVAPGTSVESLRVHGSTVAKEHPEGAVSNSIMRGTGSSQAAAVVSGAAALLLSEQPELTPDQVKGALTLTADPVPGADVAQQGAGLLNVEAARQAPARDYTQTWDRSTGDGSLEASRGSAHVSFGGEDLTGERTVWDVTPGPVAESVWNGWTWSGWTWSGWTWSGWTWSGWTWSGWTWSGWTWSGWTWSGWTWSGWTWSGWTWSGWTWS